MRFVSQCRLAALFVALCPVAGPLLAQSGSAGQARRAVPAPSIAGSYTGTLEAGEAQLHLVLHLAGNARGGFEATLDSLDQGVYAIAATSVSLSGSTLRLQVTSVGARFEGTISADHRTIDGTWSQGNGSLPLVLHRQAAHAAAQKPTDAVFPVEGVWQSALDTHGMRLRFQLHVTHDSQKELIGALDSLDQGVSGLPATKFRFENGDFHFEVPAVAGKFEGKFDAGKNTLTGYWTQTGAEQVLEFKRSDEPLALERPQTPSKPYPYREENISVKNPPADVELTGTLTIPKGEGPFPVALLIPGSGPEDRDEEMAGHKPFLVLADYLSRRGIAVLRCDKRGIGSSTGSADRSTTLDLAADAQAAVAYLKSRKEIDAKRIGLIGHSEGAMIAPYLANRSPEIRWLVLLAAPVTVGEATLINQSRMIGEVGGLSGPQLIASLTFDQDAYELARNEKDPAVLRQKVEALVKESGLDAALPPAALETQLRMLASPWFRFFLDYDPLPELQKLKTPTLALYGQKDLQVPVAFNFEPMKKALASAGNPDADVRMLADLNHLFQHAFSGSPAEYGAIEETLSPEVLEIVSDWIVRHSAT